MDVTKGDVVDRDPSKWVLLAEDGTVAAEGLPEVGTLPEVDEAGHAVYPPARDDAGQPIWVELDPALPVIDPETDEQAVDEDGKPVFTEPVLALLRDRTQEPERATVSGYHLLPDDVLMAEGWLPLDDGGPPDLEPGQSVERRVEVNGGRARAVYDVTDPPPRPVDPEAQARRDAQEAKVEQARALRRKAGRNAADTARLVDLLGDLVLGEDAPAPTG